MINVVIYDNDDKFINPFSKMITWFLKGEGINSNIVIVNNYDDFKNTLTFDNQIYILVKTDYDILKEINELNKGIPILIINELCKKEFFNFLSGNTSYKSNNSIDSNIKSIQLKDKNTYYSLNLDKIIYIVTDKNNRQTIIKYENNIYKISKSLTEIIDMLDSRFIRTHRCCYINKDRLEYIDLTNNIIKFDNGITIPYLSRRFKKYF